VFGSLPHFSGVASPSLPLCFPPLRFWRGSTLTRPPLSKLTKRVVDALRPDPKRDVFKWDAGDGALKGFGVRVKPSGVASYFVQYRNKEGRTRRLVLGRVGELTPHEARLLAADRLKEVRTGADPSAERHAARGAMTVSELCDVYVADAKGRIKPSTLAMDRSRIECHVKPLIGRCTVAGLTRRDIERFQAAVAAGKTARPSRKKGRGGWAAGGRGVAGRTVGMLGTILEYAKRHGMIADNPARGVRRFPENKRRRFLSIDELAALGRAMASGENLTGVAAIRMLLLTGCRRSEILGLPWSWLDTKARCIRFEDTKSGPQLRPIGAAAVKHLSARPRDKNSQWVFPADRGNGHFVGLPRVLARLCHRAGLKNVSVHTLRHSFAATAAELGFSELTIAGLLGHSVPGVTARYAHVPDVALIAAADRVSSQVAAALDDFREEAHVVQLRDKRPQGSIATTRA
jgi:integrase